MLSSLGACTAITLRMYAERKQWNLGSIDVKLAAAEGRRRAAANRTEDFVSEKLDAEQQAKLLEIADKTPVTSALAPGVPIQNDIRLTNRNFDPACALQLYRFEREPHHRILDAMPVVHPGPLHDAVVLFFTHFPATVVRFVDDELANVLLAP